jgi:hypothetical protein
MALAEDGLGGVSTENSKSSFLSSSFLFLKSWDGLFVSLSAFLLGRAVFVLRGLGV